MDVSRRHQLKEMVSLCRRQFGVAHFVDHQNTRGGVAAQPLPHETGIGSTSLRLRQVRERGKER